jgi:hypothetical protein
MKTFPEHPFVEGDRLVHVKSGQLATFTGTRKEVKGCDFDFFDFDNGSCCFFSPCEVAEEFKPLAK